ncbi:hypothetical protein PVW51_04640, partial [Sulfitobacter sp. PR48]|uniref:hypothetical protein n=1 Tax=Sulfitobacter sp. PR48 TaxID=3028383 RepID=UPI00237C119F
AKACGWRRGRTISLFRGERVQERAFSAIWGPRSSRPFFFGVVAPCIETDFRQRYAIPQSRMTL